MEESFSIGIKSTVYHHKLRELRGSKGLTQKEIASLVDVGYVNYQMIEQLRKFPTESEATKIADFFDVDPIELFPKWSFTLCIGSRKPITKIFKIERLALESPEVMSLPSPEDVEATVSKDLLKDDMRKAIGTLSDREQKVIKLRFGIGDNGEDKRPLTFEEVGKKFGVTRERIRQIEAKALRKMRHPSRRYLIEGYLNN